MIIILKEVFLVKTVKRPKTETEQINSLADLLRRYFRAFGNQQQWRGRH
jgi:hypothetical protein